MDVVALVVEGKLSRIGRDERKEGFASILVDVREVRPLVTGTDYEGHSLKELEKLIPGNTKAVKAIIDHGSLETETVRNSVTKWMQPIVRHEELTRFKSEYVRSVPGKGSALQKGEALPGGSRGRPGR